MLKDILAAFKSDQPAKLSPLDARTALAALLVHVAKSDEDYLEVEITRIERLLKARFNLSQDEAETLRTEAEIVEAKASDIVRFTRVVKDNVAYEDRFEVIKEMWSVALADGNRAGEESNFLRLAANLLGVNDRDSALARQEVLSEAQK